MPKRILSILSVVVFLFLAAAACAQTAATSSSAIDGALRASIEQTHVPGAVAMVAKGDTVVYQGAFGMQDEGKNVPMSVNTIFHVYSMTKAVTTVAVMQLVEKGRVKLDEPASTYLPELASLQVLDGFDADGKPILRAAKAVPTVRQLLTHTSGFGYDFVDPKIKRYTATGAVPSIYTGDPAFLKAPLAQDPGLKWEYGIGLDWAGVLVEKISGQTLEQYFQQNIFKPLGMTDSYFNVPADKQARVVTSHTRKPDGTFTEVPEPGFAPVKIMMGGGGLFSTAPDYIKFTRMILGKGKLGKAMILRAETVLDMERNQIGDLTVAMPMPGHLTKFGLGFAISTEPVENGRAAGSVAWFGIQNTFFWIDPARNTTAVLMMEIQPFGEKGARSTFEAFEKAVYSASK